MKLIEWFRNLGKVKTEVNEADLEKSRASLQAYLNRQEDGYRQAIETMLRELHEVQGQTVRAVTFRQEKPSALGGLQQLRIKSVTIWFDGGKGLVIPMLPEWEKPYTGPELPA